MVMETVKEGGVMGKPDYGPVSVKVWARYAIFTRPEAKAERVSYEVPTPSAARGVIEAIFWHKPVKWRIREILVLNEIRHFSMMRNEVKSRATERNDGISIGEDRTQRHTLGLRDVAYIIRADAHLPSGQEDDDTAKYRAQFRRRVARGQCFHRPYLGCRECACDFALPTGDEQPIDLTCDLGLMLFDINYGEHNTPRFFEAKLDRGVLRVPNREYELMERGGRA